MSKDRAKIKSIYTIKEFNTKEAKDTGEPDDVNIYEKNQFLTEGIEQIWQLIGGIDGTGYYNESNTHIGVGNGTTSTSASQTGLQGGSTAFADMDSGYPQVSGNTITFYATFGETVANFDWEEFTVVNSTDDTGENINRKVANQGTKVSGAIWEFKVELSIS